MSRLKSFRNLVRVSPFEDLLFWGLRCSKMWFTLVNLEKPKEIPLRELFYAFNMIQGVSKRQIQEDQCFSHDNLFLRAVAILAFLKYDQPLCFQAAVCTDLYDCQRSVVHQLGKLFDKPSGSPAFPMPLSIPGFTFGF
jgi:hypothetical protein